MTPTKPSIVFWITALVFLIWNLFGIFNFYTSVTATPEYYTASGYTDAQAVFMTTTPLWYLIIFGLAVWSGLLASVLNILRKAWAVKVFLFSLAMVIISFVADFVQGTFTMLGGVYIGIMVFVLVMAIIEFFVSRRYADKGVLT
jgi:hypothetical protein